MRASTKAWATLGVGVAAYDILSPKGETLSEGVDAALEHPTWRYAALIGIGVTAAHLANLIPEEYDPFHYALLWKQ